ncbi:MAG: thymidine phosphorylase [Verrucomicrobia bacterium]|nr:thymidine phosphorylase [Verrucomicrobiota bacterium]
MVPQWVIEKKRDGHALSEDDIRDFINGFTDGTIPDYQMAALAMAIYFQGMSFEEVTCLTDAMMRSGDLIDTSGIALPKVDKHSTGGIGDKVSLILAPLVACCDIAVPMISGRGLGITGGTLDKLDAIPGYRTDLSSAEFLEVLGHCGCVITGQTASLAPADRKLYALRDVSGTVPSIPLISASIMSKKLAEGTDALILDVKWGKGAFMKTLDDARDLAHTMVEIGARMNKGMVALLTDMNQPLGRTAGNALEVVETIETLNGNGPEDLVTLTLELAANMLLLCGRATDHDQAIATLQDHLTSGAALARFKTMVGLQGGSLDAIDDPTQLPTAAAQYPVLAPQSGYVLDVDAEAVGKACLVLGAGRTSVDDTVDPAVGASDIVKVGEHVDVGQPLLVLHVNATDGLDEARQLASAAFLIGNEPPTPLPLIVETITPQNP